MAADGRDDFVTIVPVGESESMAVAANFDEAAFVTVLAVGAASGAAEVIINRPRGSRLGLGLKFEGGSGVAEHVQRLLVQSCSEATPAANARSPWGKLIPGDEIIAIDGVFVSELTRIDCVRRLKDSDEILKILVRHLETVEVKSESHVKIDQSPTNDKKRPAALPPPVPPRKLNKKNSITNNSIPGNITNSEQAVNDSADRVEITTENSHNSTQCITDKISSNRNTKLLRKSSLDSHSLRKTIESAGTVHGVLKRRSPEEVRRLVRRLSDCKAIPPEADIYIDLLSQECERRFLIGDCESDDTGSSISTVVDRLSSMASSVENSKPSTPTIQPKIINIQHVLNSIENIDSKLLSHIPTSLQERVESKNMDKFILENRFTTTKPREVKDIFKDEVNIESFEIPDMFLEHQVAGIPKNILVNDKNNNTTGNITCVSIECGEPQTNLPDITKPKIRTKPQPFPRNLKPTKVTDDEVSSVSTEMSPSRILCPTKKVCIENWLQTSVECKTEQTDTKPEHEGSIPETLPRLIDFVTKPQYKAVEKPDVDVQSQYFPKVSEFAVVARDDGSGASLNTIGEDDDEGSETLHANPHAYVQVAQESQYKAANIPDQKISSDGPGAVWRGNDINGDLRVMINYDGAPPIFPRQPPDGDEAPCKVDEVFIATPAAKVSIPATSTSTTRILGDYTRRSIYSRLQDARSECSVKDKIAMFSNQKAISTDRVDKIGVLSITKSLAHHPTALERHPLDRRLTKSSENLDEVPNSTYRQRNIGKRPEVVGGLDRTSYDEIDNKMSMKDSHFVFSDYTKYYNTNLGKNTVVNVPDKNSKPIKNIEKTPNSTLDYIIKQRREGISKLRSLMIPEVKAHIPIVDLPEIKVRSTFNYACLNQLNPANVGSTSDVNRNDKIKESRKSNITDSFKTNSLPHNIPKYSPAFKRKSLQVYNNNEITNPKQYLDSNKNKIPLKPPRMSIEHNKVGEIIAKKRILPLANKESKYNILNDINVGVNTKKITRSYPSAEFADSDNDSAVSSNQSSCRSSASSPLPTAGSIESDSSHVSPGNSECTSCLVKIKSKENQIQSAEMSREKGNVTRSVSTDTTVSFSSSTGSAATSGSQASCSSLESSQDTRLNMRKNKIIRTHSIDTIQRRHILASAKCRSGRDLKSSSPLIDTKFSHENENVPSPETKPSDRFSTLNINVSASSNKGESRRSWAKHIESDTDSDNDLQSHRKNDFKSLRPRKHISATSKTEFVRKEKELSSKRESEGNENKHNIPDKTKTFENHQKEDTIKFRANNYALDKISKDSQTICQSVPTSVSITSNSVHKNISETNIINSKDKVKILTSPKVPPLYQKIDNVVEPVYNITKESESSQIKKCLRTVRLQRGSGTGVGLVLAGGIDCEAKTVTIHKVLNGGPAEKDGRLCKGNRVVSINGHDMSGATHAHSVSVLKELRSEVVLVVEGENASPEKTSTSDKARDTQEFEVSEHGEHEKHEKRKREQKREGELMSVVVVKGGAGGAGAGLGLGLAGGRDAPTGDCPLTVKKLFTGGAAARSGRIAVGATLEMVNGERLEGMTRTQAWNMFKALSPGPVTLVLRPPPSAPPPQ